jgi:hypothetical protein
MEPSNHEEDMGSDEEEDEEWQEYLNQSSEPINALDKLFAGIGDLIADLYRLSVNFQNRASSKKIWEDSVIDKTYFESLDIDHARESFCGIPEWLVTRLGKANTKRRRLLAYLKDHHDKMIHYVDASPEDLDRWLTTHKTPHFTTEKPIESGQGLSGDDFYSIPYSLGPHPEFQSQKPQTTATKVFEEPHPNFDALSEAAVSQTPCTPMEGFDCSSILNIPSTPNRDIAWNNQPFQCPHCLEIVQFISFSDWE